MVPETDMCYECVCEEDYDSNLPLNENKHCHRINCGMELVYLNKIRDGCVPVYLNEKACCALGTICRTYPCYLKRNLLFITIFCFAASESDKLVTSSLSVTDELTHTCKFGKLNLKINEEVETTDKCSKCKCAMPPLVTCTKIHGC